VPWLVIVLVVLPALPRRVIGAVGGWAFLCRLGGWWSVPGWPGAGFVVALLGPGVLLLRPACAQPLFGPACMSALALCPASFLCGLPSPARLRRRPLRPPWSVPAGPGPRGGGVSGGWPGPGLGPGVSVGWARAGGGGRARRRGHGFSGSPARSGWGQACPLFSRKTLTGRAKTPRAWAKYRPKIFPTICQKAGFEVQLPYRKFFLSTVLLIRRSLCLTLSFHL
jgi:hypothetical protein